MDLWREFLAAEQEWADKGSGMTRDQMTGAVLFLLWLEKRNAPIISNTYVLDGSSTQYTLTNGVPES